MANYANLLAQIAANIYSNNNQEITGDGLQLQLNAMVASLGAGYQFMGVAHPADTPSGYADLRAFWLAGEAGTYTDFGGQVLNDGEVAVIKYDGNGWSKEATGAISAGKLSNFTSISDAGVLTRMPELYLTGLDNSLNYYASICYYVYNDYRVAQVYIYSYLSDRSNSTRVAYYESSRLSGVVPIHQENNSGIEGFALINLQTTDTAAQTAEISKSRVSIMENSPTIYYYTSNTLFLSNNTETARKRLVALNLSGLNKSKRYYISNLRFYIYGSYRVAQVYINEFTTSPSSSTIVAYYEGTVKNGIVDIVENNSSGISGKAIINIDESDTTNVTPEICIYAVSNPLLFDFQNEMNQLLSVRKEFFVGAGKPYTRLRDAVADAIQTNGSIVHICGGTYDILSEFATEIAAVPSAQIGIKLENDIRVIFEEGAKVTCLYPSANQAVNQFLSPFYSGSIGGFTLENAIIISSNCRYCVHDDPAAGSTQWRKIRFINCKMTHDETGAYNNYYPQCIGGGMTNLTDVEIIGCYFKTKRAETEQDIPSASYHNTNATASAFGVFHISNSYFADKSTWASYYYGTTPSKSSAYISGCRLGAIPILAPTGGAQINNMEIIAFANEIAE